MTTIFEDKFHSVAHDPDHRLLVMTRRPGEALTAGEIGDAFGAMVATMKRSANRAYGLVMDLRDGPLQSNPSFDAVIRPRIVDMVSQFAFCAVLVKTAVGKLQMTRYGRELGLNITVFDDQSAMQKYVETTRHSMKPPSSRP